MWVLDFLGVLDIQCGMNTLLLYIWEGLLCRLMMKLNLKYIMLLKNNCSENNSIMHYTVHGNNIPKSIIICTSTQSPCVQRYIHLPAALMNNRFI